MHVISYIYYTCNAFLLQGMTSTGLVWYINGYMVPELWLRRGLTYSFMVYGGNNPHSAETYHPFIITDEPHGGYDRLSEQVQQKVRVLAGVEFTRRGQPKPTTGEYLYTQNLKSKYTAKIHFHLSQ